MGKIILHIDFDSFFASVEQQYNPSLRNKPIGVTAANGRTCIIASSREAKKLGIKTGTRSFEAERIYPGIILVGADFVKYWEVSKKFINICKDYSPFLEVFSIDELFMDVTPTADLFNGSDGIVETIRKRIKEEIGEYITVSFGISYNKLLAKLASGFNKPNGICSIAVNEVERIYARAKLTDICGIGERVRLRLNTIGIYTLLQLRTASLTLLVSEFGPAEAGFLKKVGLAIDDSPLVSYTQAPEVKSVGRNYCLPHNEYDHRIVLQNIYELCEEVGIKLRRIKKKARTVGLSLRGSKNIHQQRTYTNYINSGKEIFDVCLVILNSNSLACNLEGCKLDYVRQISVWVSNLEDKNHLQQSLFDIEKKKERLVSAVDKINERFGDHTIRNGFLLNSEKLTTVPNGYMARFA